MKTYFREFKIPENLKLAIKNHSLARIHIKLSMKCLMMKDFCSEFSEKQKAPSIVQNCIK